MAARKKPAIEMNVREKANQAFRNAIKSGLPVDEAQDAAAVEWVKAFAANLRPAVAVLLGGAVEVRRKWQQACKLVKKGEEVALAKAIIGRREPPFFDVNSYLLPAARLLREEPEWLGKAAEDFLIQCKNLKNYRLGQEDTLRELRALCPTTVLTPTARKLISELSASRKYAPIAGALREWGGIGGKAVPADAPDAEPAKVVARFEALTRQAIAARSAAALQKLGREMDKLDLLEASDEPANLKRIDDCVQRLSAHLQTHPKPLSRAALRELEGILDSVTSS